PPGDPAEGGAREEEADGDEEERPAAVDVAELPVQRHGHRGREQVRREDPGVAREAAELADDPRQRGGDDGLVERREQERDHKPRVYDEDPADREPVARRLAGEAGAEARDHAGSAAGRVLLRHIRGRAIPTAMKTAPSTCSAVSGSERMISANTAPMNGCTFANSVAREGPTRSIAVNQSTLVITRGPSSA